MEQPIHKKSSSIEDVAPTEAEKALVRVKLSVLRAQQCLGMLRVLTVRSNSNGTSKLSSVDDLVNDDGGPHDLTYVRTALSDALLSTRFGSKTTLENSIAELETLVTVAYKYPAKRIRHEGLRGPPSYPPWISGVDDSFDVAATCIIPQPTHGLPQIGSRCAMQSCFAIVLCSGAWRRRGDQPRFEDMIKYMSPTAQLTYATMMTDYEALDLAKRSTISKVLSDSLPVPSKAAHGHHNVCDIFQKMLSGAASFSFTSANLPICPSCSHPILSHISEVKPKIVDNNIASIPRSQQDLQQAINKLFGPKEYAPAKEVPMVNIDDDGSTTDTMQSPQLAEYSCPSCKVTVRPTGRRFVVMDRLPKFLALAFDRGDLNISGQHIAQQSLPADWKQDLSISNAIKTSGKRFPAAQYKLRGGVCHIAGTHYSTVWYDKSDPSKWRHYDGMVNEGRHEIISQEKAFKMLGDYPASILVYQQK